MEYQTKSHNQRTCNQRNRRNLWCFWKLEFQKLKGTPWAQLVAVSAAAMAVRMVIVTSRMRRQMFLFIVGRKLKFFLGGGKQ